MSQPGQRPASDWEKYFAQTSKAGASNYGNSGPKQAQNPSSQERYENQAYLSSYASVASGSKYQQNGGLSSLSSQDAKQRIYSNPAGGIGSTQIQQSRALSSQLDPRDVRAFGTGLSGQSYSQHSQPSYEREYRPEDAASLRQYQLDKGMAQRHEEMDDRTSYQPTIDHSTSLRPSSLHPQYQYLQSSSIGGVTRAQPQVDALRYLPAGGEAGRLLEPVRASAGGLGYALSLDPLTGKYIATPTSSRPEYLPGGPPSQQHQQQHQQVHQQHQQHNRPVEYISAASLRPEMVPHHNALQSRLVRTHDGRLLPQHEVTYVDSRDSLGFGNAVAGMGTIRAAPYVPEEIDPLMTLASRSKQSQPSHSSPSSSSRQEIPKNLSKRQKRSSSRSRSRSRSPKSRIVRRTSSPPRRGARNNNQEMSRRDRPIVVSTGRRSRSRSRSPPARRIRQRERSRSESKPPAIAPVPVSIPAKEVDCRKIPASVLFEQFHAPPALSSHCFSLSQIDLMAKFPNLYIPEDFVQIQLEWDLLVSKLPGGMRDIATTAPVVVQNAAGDIMPEAGIAADSPLLSSQSSIVSCGSEDLHFARQHRLTSFGNARPIKFNARALLTIGVQDSETDRLDATLMRKLRVICGRRKGNVQLLGGSWSQEQDGGNPLVDLNDCLLHTLRRTVLAQSMLDVFSCCEVIPMAEVLYHRPKEEDKGVVLPEQDEITKLFLCVLHPSSSPNFLNYLENFPNIWEHYAARCCGLALGPSVGVSGEDSSNLLKNDPPESILTWLQQNDSWVEDKSGSEVPLEATSVPTNPEPVAADPLESAETNENSKTPDVEASSSASNATKVKLPEKPTRPTYLLCPQPIVGDDDSHSKRSQAVSLRMLNLSSLLCYSLDDVNERVFEVSFAAELLQSLVGVTYADIISDFVVAEFGEVSGSADPRAAMAVTVLRRLAAKTASKRLNAAVEIKEDSPSSPPPPSSNDVAPAESTLGEEAKEGVPMEDIRASPLQCGDSEKVDPDDAAVEAMTDDEARLWRRKFVCACRWFDVEQNRYLRADHLELILQSSSRGISKADIASAIWHVCRDDKLRYEICI